jgi:hypothetical protein
VRSLDGESDGTSYFVRPTTRVRTSMSLSSHCQPILGSTYSGSQARSYFHISRDAMLAHASQVPDAGIAPVPGALRDAHCSTLDNLSPPLL